MGKVTPLTVTAVVLVTALLVPLHVAPAHAQSATPLACTTTPLTAPMQGHYTGTWHSEGDYHFNAFNTDLDLKIIIDGALDATMTAGGELSGTAVGKVQAPITHDGHQDVSSGTGTISGQLQGVFTTSGPVVVLSNPVIDMHWGTFVGGGYTVERFVSMPQYQFPVSGFDCISAQGTSAETNFPVMTVTNDGLGGEVQVPGIGTATGTWQVTSDGAADFARYSQQVDAFIASSDALLNDPNQVLTPSLVQQEIVGPLTTLESAIRAEPDIARCLLDRLGIWQASAVRRLLARVTAGSDPVALRRSADALRAANLVDLDCPPPDPAIATSLVGSLNARVDAALGARNWSAAALALRESMLLAGNPGRTALQRRLGDDFHRLLSIAKSVPVLRDEARAAYTFGDESDARAAWLQAARLAARASVGHTTGAKSGRKSSLPASLQSQSVKHLLVSGTRRLSVSAPSGTPAWLTWSALPGAATYVVAVTTPKAPRLIWSWSGATTSVQFGDTAIAGTAGTADDGWPIALDGGPYAWTILALDRKGRIMGASFRARL